MTNLFKIKEMLIAATQENKHLNTLIKLLNINLLKNPAISMLEEEAVFLKNYVNKLAEFSYRFALKIDSLTELFNNALNNDGTFNKNNERYIDILEKQYSELNKSFQEIHHNFITDIDERFDNFICDHASKINSINESALQYAKNRQNDAKYQEKIDTLYETVQYLQARLKPLSEILDEIEFDQSLYPDYDNMPINDRNEMLEERIDMYEENLEHLRIDIVNKLLFQYTKNSIKNNCSELLTIINECDNSPSFFNQPKRNNYKMALEFIKNNFRFFLAPYENFDAFKTWADKNSDSLMPLSEGSIKHLHSRDQSHLFEKALKQYAFSREQALLEWLLGNHTSHHLNDFLAIMSQKKSLMNVINEWYKDHPKDVEKSFKL